MKNKTWRIYATCMCTYFVVLGVHDVHVYWFVFYVPCYSVQGTCASKTMCSYIVHKKHCYSGARQASDPWTAALSR